MTKGRSCRREDHIGSPYLGSVFFSMGVSLNWEPSQTLPIPSLTWRILVLGIPKFWRNHHVGDHRWTDPLLFGIHCCTFDQGPRAAKGLNFTCQGPSCPVDTLPACTICKKVSSRDQQGTAWHKKCILKKPSFASTHSTPRIGLRWNLPETYLLGGKNQGMPLENAVNQSIDPMVPCNVTGVTGRLIFSDALLATLKLPCTLSGHGEVIWVALLDHWGLGPFGAHPWPLSKGNATGWNHRSQTWESKNFQYIQIISP